MFLRFTKLNSKGCEENLHIFWPTIQCKLIQIFTSLREIRLEDRIWLIFDSLRLLEIMSMLNISDHTLFQWAFITDCIFYLLKYT